MKAIVMLSFIVGCAALAACTSTAPLTGQMQKSDETFNGIVSGSGYSGGLGELTLVSSRNAECKGSFTYTSRRRGEGVLHCTDGRTGPFHIAGAGATGNGYGDLNGQRFTFSFGPQ